MHSTRPGSRWTNCGARETFGASSDTSSILTSGWASHGRRHRASDGKDGARGRARGATPLLDPSAGASDDVRGQRGVAPARPGRAGRHRDVELHGPRAAPRLTMATAGPIPLDLAKTGYSYVERPNPAILRLLERHVLSKRRARILDVGCGSAPTHAPFTSVDRTPSSLALSRTSAPWSSHGVRAARCSMARSRPGRELPPPPAPSTRSSSRTSSSTSPTQSPSCAAS